MAPVQKGGNLFIQQMFIALSNCGSSIALGTEAPDAEELASLQEGGPWATHGERPAGGLNLKFEGRVSHPHPVGIWSRLTLCCGGCPEPCRVFRSILGLYLLDASHRSPSHPHPPTAQL